MNTLENAKLNEDLLAGANGGLDESPEPIEAPYHEPKPLTITEDKNGNVTGLALGTLAKGKTEEYLTYHPGNPTA